MNLIATLENLRNKYRENDYRLSRSDTEKAREKITQLLEEEDKWELGIDFIIDFPSEIGISAYVNYYKTAPQEKRLRLNRLLVNNQRFRDNENFISIKRGGILINKLLMAGANEEELIFLLQKLNKLILEQTGTEVNQIHQQELLEIFASRQQISKLEERLMAAEQKNRELEKIIEESQEKNKELKILINGLKKDIISLKKVKRKLNKTLYTL